MNRNRLKENLKYIVSEERHLRFVYDEETELYVPYENEDELRLMADHNQMYKIAFGQLGPGGVYYEESVTDYYCSPECLMFNDENYFSPERYLVTYDKYTHPAIVLDAKHGLCRNVAMYILKFNDITPLGYRQYTGSSTPIAYEPME